MTNDIARSANPSTIPATSREIRLASRPEGPPTAETYELVEAEVPALRPGQVLVRNTLMSVDPYMRGRMNEGPSYIAPFAVGEPLEGSAAGQVVASADADIPVGAEVVHFAGWRELSVLDRGAATVIDTSSAPASAYLGPLGTTGLTAYLALTRFAPVEAGETVFVSAAAGAVGSVAGQIARLLGAGRVVGSAGGAEKARRLVDDFGFDAAIDHRAGDLPGQLAAAAPGGIDVYLDSVGGDHLEAAIGAMRDHGRIALVGAISGYNSDDQVPGPRNLYEAVKKRITLRGMIVSDHFDAFPEYLEHAVPWLASGQLRTAETVVEGLERAPEALLGVLDGTNVGKMLVRIS
ncbi:NADP-dependent oxidoreductase [Aeromicrobium sp. Root236]|uniref:NADP-dependent oxidoreductase n=1 Tax=Aeromicrobium sp. Root236 TaxID=1736498 RepID=UPI0006FEF24E|nr:NADP-dependent oxidoreductase [Aeromicrobium sp. Root236]KRC63994.1 NADP-dependent oxidoreductase [Aeromicrobium sp. Root236]